jgi:hypothetical protein
VRRLADKLGRFTDIIHVLAIQHESGFVAASASISTSVFDDNYPKSSVECTKDGVLNADGRYQSGDDDSLHTSGAQHWRQVWGMDESSKRILIDNRFAF